MHEIEFFGKVNARFVRIIVMKWNAHISMRAGIMIDECKKARVAAKCPHKFMQIGKIGANTHGCGLDNCNARYKYKNVAECARACESDSRCKSFNWAPMDGDQNHAGMRVCTRYPGN